MMSNLVNWKLFAVLCVAAALANAAVLPYALHLGPGALKMSRLPVPLGAAIALQLAQSTLFFAAVIFVGLLLGRAVGLGAPFLEGWLEGTKPTGVPRALMLAAALGALVGIPIFVLDRFVFALAIESVTAAQAHPPVWTRLLVSVYGGIGEELVMRLGLMTLIVWVTWKIRAAPGNAPTDVGVWLAIILVSIVFGLGHLPMTARITQTSLTPLVVFRALALNVPASVIFGWLYWRRGLEAAMVSHFSTDIVLHVLLPLLV